MIEDEECRNEIFQFSIHNAHELALVFDESGRILYANKSADEKLGYGMDLFQSYIWEDFPGATRLTEPTGISMPTGRTGLVFRSMRGCFREPVSRSFTAVWHLIPPSATCSGSAPIRSSRRFKASDR